MSKKKNFENSEVDNSTSEHPDNETTAEELVDEELVIEDSTEESTIPLSQYEKIKDDYLRLAADFDNFRKRTEKEKESITKTTISLFISKLLPLIDNFEIATSQENVHDETKTLQLLLETVLKELNVTEVGVVGEEFDPAIHEAVEHTGEGEKQKIDVVLRKGYLYQSYLIRPAMVKVISE
ncbi:MAG: nucleotide exchange factor GrpE [Actinomycetota bacterium]|nr:nucleotide exchange factor GrpE [Actinomycetota bacterium]MDA3013062.1 nucleotide exchange factor GrpE [Actinomycetota bacterium]